MKNIYLIKDLARISGHSVYTIKYYLKEGLIEEIGRSPSTNFRYFDNTTLGQLRRIHKLRKEKNSLKRIGNILFGSN